MVPRIPGTKTTGWTRIRSTATYFWFVANHVTSAKIVDAGDG